jgi:hypothetical protein
VWLLVHVRTEDCDTRQHTVCVYEFSICGHRTLRVYTVYDIGHGRVTVESMHETDHHAMMPCQGMGIEP